MKHVLIVYGSFSGSTAEIADSMKTYLGSNTCEVTLLPASGNQINLSKYDLIIIGSAIRGDRIYGKIGEFIKINRPVLNQKKIAVFAVCGTIASTNEKKREHALSYTNNVACGLSTTKKAVFAGKINKTGWFGDMMGKMIMGLAPGDYRDWNKIRDWTLSINEVLYKKRKKY